MNSLVIRKTDSTPEISFLQKGELTITGRSLPEDVHKFYDPLIDWVKKYEGDKVKVELKLEYLNTIKIDQMNTSRILLFFSFLLLLSACGDKNKMKFEGILHE